MSVSAASPVHRSQAPAQPVAARPTAKAVSVKPAGGDHDGDGDDRGKTTAKVAAPTVQAPRPGQKVNGAVYL